MVGYLLENLCLNHLEMAQKAQDAQFAATLLDMDEEQATDRCFWVIGLDWS